MKKYIILLYIVFGFGIVWAQSSTNLQVPWSVAQNCLINQSGGIDFCPLYWTQVRDINLKLAKQWSQAEHQGVVTLLDTLSANLKKFTVQNTTLIRNTLNGYPLFTSDYEQYLTNLFLSYIKHHTETTNLVQSFFDTTTYFDQDQSGLGISQVQLFRTVPQQYDDSILLQVSVRNYTHNPLSNIEDLYCFSTVNDQDYIYPMQIKTSFKEDSITNLIVELKAGFTPLLEQAGEKKIACTLVYAQYGQTKYTNRWKLIFTLPSAWEPSESS